MAYQFKLGKDFATDRDKSDNLSKFREQFFNSDENIIYLDGNSLGKLPLESIDRINNVVKDQWGNRLIRSWNEHWLELPKRTAAKLAGIIGAKPEEVILCDSTSLNLFKLVLASLKMNPERKIILSDEFNFPSDIYVIKGVIDLLDSGHRLELIKSTDAFTPDTESIDNYLNDDLAMITLSHVVFKSSYKYDMKSITAKAHSCGAKVVWDLSHSAGAVPIELNNWNVDFAVGCTYKYLNGGPGSNAFLYIREDLIEKVQNFIQGWLGSNEPFMFNLDYNPAASIEKFVVGTPQVLSMSPIEPALDIVLHAGLKEIRSKSIEQSEYLIYLFDQYLSELGFELNSPRNYQFRGSHVSISHNEAYRICQALIKSQNIPKNIIPDFRMPDNIRLGIAPLYNSFQDIYETVKIIKLVVDSDEFKNFSPAFETVT